MGRTVEISGNLLVYLLYAVSLAVVPVGFYFTVWPLDDLASVLGTVLLAGLVLVVAADLWHWKTGQVSEHLTTAAKRNLPYDISYDPSAYPGQAAKDRWLQAVEDLSDEDDADE
jgi:hypothetical protein